MYKYQVGSYYKLQNGDTIKVLGRVDDCKGYETLFCSDHRYRYDRSTHSEDAGRCTGTPHDYSCEFNIAKEEA